MKKRFFSLFVCTALLLSVVFSAHTAWAASSSDEGGIYTDPDTGATFIVPDGWTVDTINLEDAANFYQVKYTSWKDSGSSFLYGSYDLWDSMSASERSGHTRSEVDSAYIYEEGSLIESLVNSAPELGIAINPADIHLVSYGDNEFIEIPTIQEMAGIRIPATLFWYIENGYSYNFSFGSTSDQATRDFHSVLSCLQVSASAEADRSSGGPYTDPDTGAVFVVPEGWIERELGEDIPAVFQVKFASQEYPGSNFMYGSADLWSTMTASERSGHIRADIDSAYIYAYEDGALIEYMAESMIQDAADTGGYVSLDKIALVTYGSNEMIEFSSSQEISGIRFPVTTIFHVENGYMYTFVFASNNDQASQDFQSVMDSFQVSAAKGSGSDGAGSGQPDELVDKIMLLFAKVLFFLGELAFTFFFLALPFFLYRNRFRKRPVGKIITLIIVIPYMILVYWLLMEVTRHYFTPWVPLIWCCFTYRDMTRKKDSDALPTNAADGSAPQPPVNADIPHSAAYARPQTVSAAPAVPQMSPAAPAAATQQTHPPVQQTPASRVQFCRNCGFRLLEDSKFCSCCGTPVVPITKE